MTDASVVADDDLRERLRFEIFFADVTSRFLAAEPDALSLEIECALAGLVETLGIDRATIALFTPDRRSIVTTHSAGVPPFGPQEIGIDLGARLPWYVEQARLGRRLVYDRVAHALPEQAVAERLFVAEAGIKSHTALPLVVGTEVLGGLGVSTFARSRTWSPEFLARLDLLAGTFAHAVYRRETEARLQGAREALERSLAEVQELKDRLQAENVLLHSEVLHAHGFDTIVGRSEALGRVLRQIEQVAPTDAPVLLLGETGTGKELVARALHDRSPRRERPLVTVNCAALPAALVESALFGHERGAFTDAIQRSVGRFELADGGTLFLDEVGELPLDLQAKLLRVLQSGEFERLGSPRTLRADVRVIAATNRDLERERREGRFRADLFYRLGVFPVSLPPLRERPEDIPLLVWHFIGRKQERFGRAVRRIPERAMRALAGYSWPGNVRELENVIERALILSSGATLAAEPVVAATGPPADAAAQRLEDVERAHIRAVLVECGWKVAGPGNAAERLGLRRSTLQFRMQKLGIARPARPRG